MAIKLLGWVNEFFYLGPVAPNSNWGFEGMSPRLDQLADNMRGLGLSPAYVDGSIRQRGVNQTFESLVYAHDHLVDRVVSDAIAVSDNPDLSYDKKREYVVDGIIHSLQQQKPVRASG